MAFVNTHEAQRPPPVRMMQAMQGGYGKDSYARNSSPQNYNFHAVAKPRLGAALSHVIQNLVRAARDQAAPSSVSDDTGVEHGRLRLTEQQPSPPRIAIADLGCSHGRKTLECAQFVLNTLQQIWLLTTTTSVLDDDAPGAVVQQGALKQDFAKMQSNDEVLEIQYFFSDLPSNDLNALFRSLQPYFYPNDAVCTGQDHHALPKIFAAGVPGSFYGRLFPSSSLNLVICSYSLHWLSRGLLSLEEMEMFNVPMYMFDQQEFEHVLLDIPELDVIRMETLENMALFQEQKDRMHAVQQWKGLVASIMRPLLEAQLSKDKVDEVLKRIKVIASKLHCFDTMITQNFLIACLKRRA